VGLRWCGGGRRTNLGGFHDQIQIKAKGHVPHCRTKAEQTHFPQATYTVIIEDSNANGGSMSSNS
jgi:hypothetical protein